MEPRGIELSHKRVGGKQCNINKKRRTTIKPRRKVNANERTNEHQTVPYLVTTKVEVLQHGVKEGFDRKFGINRELQLLTPSLDFREAVFEYRRALLGTGYCQAETDKRDYNQLWKPKQRGYYFRAKVVTMVQA